jgi:hypothetical protein
VVATVLVSVCFYAEQAILARKGVMAPVAVFAFCKVVPDTIFAAELVNSQVRSLGTKVLDTIGNRLSLCGIAQFQRCAPLLILFF